MLDDYYLAVTNCMIIFNFNEILSDLFGWEKTISLFQFGGSLHEQLHEIHIVLSIHIVLRFQIFLHSAYTKMAMIILEEADTS